MITLDNYNVVLHDGYKPVIGPDDKPVMVEPTWGYMLNPPEGLERIDMTAYHKHGLPCDLLLLNHWFRATPTKDQTKRNERPALTYVRREG